MEGWNTTWPNMLDTTPSLITFKPQKFVLSQNKLISVKEIFKDISRQMLETINTLNLGQLLKMALELRKKLC